MKGTPEDLARIGFTAFGGESSNPPGWSGVAVAELDSYAIAFLEAAGYPSNGTEAYSAARDRFLDELSTLAEAGGDWAFVGAFMVAKNALVEMEGSPGYRDMLERGVDFLRLDGVAFPAIPPFALDHYQEVHGCDGLSPADWPSALVSVDVPDPGAGPDVEPLGAGEARRVAESRAQGLARQIFAECREDEEVVAVFEGVVDDGSVARWDWMGVSGPDYQSFLRELGERLVTPTPWYHPDLAPYFPCRDRTRDEMRREALTRRA